MATLIDRTSETNQSSESRKRLVDRVKASLLASLKSGESSNLAEGLSLGETIIVTDDLSQPFFSFADMFPPSESVIRNFGYNRGDIIIYSKWELLMGALDGGDEESGEDGDEDGDGSTSGFRNGGEHLKILLTDDEFRDILFEGFRLPDLKHKPGGLVTELHWKHAGYKQAGTPSSLDLKKTYRNALGRKRATQAALNQRLEELDKLLRHPEKMEGLDEDTLNQFRIEQEELKTRSIPMFIDLDTRYHTYKQVKKPVTAAVVFILLDVSASMDSVRRHLAKTFFSLFKLFIKGQYDRVELVFIIHTEDAREVSEKDFFDGTESGGTDFLKAYRLVQGIVDTRYPAESYNHYMVHCSDSETSCTDELRAAMDRVLPVFNLAVYLNVGSHNALPYGIVEAFVKNNVRIKHMDRFSDPYKSLKELFGGNHD